MTPSLAEKAGTSASGQRQRHQPRVRLRLRLRNAYGLWALSNLMHGSRKLPIFSLNAGVIKADPEVEAT